MTGGIVVAGGQSLSRRGGYSCFALVEVAVPIFNSLRNYCRGCRGNLAPNVTLSIYPRQCDWGIYTTRILVGFCRDRCDSDDRIC